jgi:hypothetical protein
VLLSRRLSLVIAVAMMLVMIIFSAFGPVSERGIAPRFAEAGRKCIVMRKMHSTSGFAGGCIPHRTGAKHNAGYELRRTPYWRSAQNSTSTTFVNKGM